MSAPCSGAACGQPFLVPADGDINGHAKDAASDMATPGPCQVLPWTHSTTPARLRKAHRVALATPDTLQFWLLQNCNKIHIYLQHTMLAAFAFTEQLSTGADVRLRLQKHPAKSPLTPPPLFNWHQTQICHLQVTSPAWPLRGWAVINLLKCWASRRDSLNSQAFYFITEDFMCLLHDEFCSWVSDLYTAQG